MILAASPPGRGLAAPLPSRLRWQRLGAARCLLGVEAPPLDGGLEPIDWAPPWPDQLPHQADLLWIEGPHGERVVLPHVVEMGPFRPGEGGEVAVQVAAEPLFRPRLPVEAAGEAWDGQADALGMRRPYDPRYGTARLRRVARAPAALCLEPVRYTDYVRTNLGLDCPLPDGRTLRGEETRGGRLRPLEDSDLANTVGTGILLFSADGALVVQRRSEGRVLFRAGELCPGGSGTLDWDDVLRCRGGRLAELDVYREAYEEVGVQPVAEQLLGVTRELIRLDPGIWMAADTAETARHILSDAAHRRRDDEGALLCLPLGPFGRARPDPAPTRAEFWAMITALTHLGPPSVPLLTNLALWWISAVPRRGGVASLPELRGGG
jgi:ADP-ribose pyrophosphatase YjhB (NUDIX family)